MIFYTVLIATFALWFGGFTFYVSFVVPVGTEVLGSARSQGFITQQVTNWLNVTCGFALGLMVLELVFSWKRMRRPGRVTQVLMLIAIGLLLIALVWMHPLLDRMLVPAEERVADREKFYAIHRLYLWFSTFQWVAAWVWLLISVVTWNRQIQTRPNAAYAG